MKTSNKLIIAALLLVIVSLIGYDYLLKAAYLSGEYKDPYKNFRTLNFRGFDSVDVVSSTAINVKFIQGPFSVRIDPNALEYARINQTGRRLRISAVFGQDYLFNPNPYIMVISCPKLIRLNTSAAYRANGQPVTDTIVRDNWKMRQVLIDGFKQDSLIINQDYGSTVMLAHNHIGQVMATTGKSSASGSKLIIAANNQFGTADLSILNNSRLLLDSASITDLHYRLADSAKLVLIGRARQLINSPKTNKQ